MMDKVSVIIPAYNTEQYIDEMLTCVINQTYKNLEIIIINDGSTDSTLDHINYFADKDKRIKVIDIPNGGVSNARNVGLKCCSGSKIFFWDSDDIIEDYTIEHCLNYSNKENVNAVLYGYSNRYNGVNGSPFKSTLNKKYVGEKNKKELISRFIGHSFSDINNWLSGQKKLREEKEHTALWRIMLDIDTIKKYNILFDVNLSLGEDTKFMCEYLLRESSIGYLDECLYHLTQRTSGANMTSNSNPELMMENKLKLINARFELDDLGNENNIDLHTLWEGTMVFSAVQLVLEFSKYKQNGYKLIKKYLNNSNVKRAINNFQPIICIKAIPFLLIKYHMCLMLYLLFSIIPNKIIKKIIYKLQ